LVGTAPRGLIDRAMGDDAKSALIASRELKADDWLTERSVALARRNGYHWAQIGRLLVMTRQSARERFRTAPPRLPPHIVAREKELAEQRRAERLFNQIASGTYRSADVADEDAVPW
jgi:hypothetical protein